MITIRRSADRGRTRTDWLDSRHTFSFGDYRDPRFRAFGALRVINEDVVAPGGGFATHGHRDMEIISIVLSGGLAHRDSLGNGSVIRPGEVQRMSAGTGIHHSEFNASETEPVHFLQIWIAPSERGLAPSYEQRPTEGGPAGGALRLTVSPDGRDGSILVHQDARIYDGRLEPGTPVAFTPPPGRRVWLQAIEGAIDVNGERLLAGDGAGVEDPEALSITAPEGGRVLVFDLP